MELAGRYGEQRPQAAVAVYAKRLMVLAAVGEATDARVARLAVDVGLDAAAVTGLHVRHARANGHHLDAEFVPRDPRITEKRHLPQEAPVVGAADAHRVDADHRLAGARRWRLRNVDEPKRLRAFEKQGLHGVSFAASAAAPCHFSP